MASVHPPLRDQVDEVSKANYKALKSRRDDEVVGRLKKELDQFKEVMPLLAEVRASFVIDAFAFCLSVSQSVCLSGACLVPVVCGVLPSLPWALLLWGGSIITEAGSGVRLLLAWHVAAACLCRRLSAVCNAVIGRCVYLVLPLLSFCQTSFFSGSCTRACAALAFHPSLIAHHG